MSKSFILILFVCGELVEVHRLDPVVWFCSSPPDAQGFPRTPRFCVSLLLLFCELGRVPPGLFRYAGLIHFRRLPLRRSAWTIFIPLDSAVSSVYFSFWGGLFGEMHDVRGMHDIFWA